MRGLQVSVRISCARISLRLPNKLQHWWSLTPVALNVSQNGCMEPHESPACDHGCSAGLCNRTLGCAKRRASARQLAIFPLAPTTVGWVPDRTPAGPKRSGGLGAKRRVVRAGCRLTIELKGTAARKNLPLSSSCC